MKYYILSLLELFAPVYDIDPNLAKAVVQVESQYEPSAIGPVGEIGLFQIRPEYSRLSAQDLHSIELNIHEGLRKLAKAKRDCKHKHDKTFVVCYNAGVTGGSNLRRPKQFPYYKKVMDEYIRK